MLALKNNVFKMENEFQMAYWSHYTNYLMFLYQQNKKYFFRNVKDDITFNCMKSLMMVDE